jgi:pimeloyl-ACP methyl ester carboxylesterase
VTEGFTILTSNQFDHNNIRLHYMKGPESGPPVILLHGLSDSWRTYLNFIPFISSCYTVYLPDLRGHGESYRADSYKVLDYTYDIELFLTELFNGPVSLIGHSLGATISLVIAARQPEKCRSISLIEPFIFKDRLDNREMRKYFKGCLKVCERYTNIDSMSKNLKETGTLARKRASDLLKLDIKAIKTVLDKTIFDGFNIGELLSKIVCPVLVIRGNPDLDAFITEEKANYLKKAIGNCVMEYLEDSSHVVHVDQPFNAVQYLLDFLASV